MVYSPLTNIFWDQPFLTHLFEFYLSIKDLNFLDEFTLFQKFIYVH